MTSRALTLIAAMILCLPPLTLIADDAQEQGNNSAITIENPIPLINQPLTPDAIKPGASGFTLTVNGTGFVSGSVVRWNGSTRATKFVSRSRLTAGILAADIAHQTTASVTVVNESPGGGTSNPAFFEVTSPTPAIALKRSSYNTGSGSQSVATADFNGDGILDLVVANIYSNTVSVLIGTGNGTFRPPVDYATGLNPTSVAVGDFNGDGNLDIIVAKSGGTVALLLGNGDGSFRAPLDSPTGSGPLSVAVGDFNGDGKLDVVTANNNSNLSGTVSVLLGNGDGTFQTHVDYDVGMGPYAVAVGDFNGDGKLDLLAVNYADATLSILLGNGDGTFLPRVDYTTGTQPISVAIGDFNRDGRLDLAVASFFNGTVGIFLGNGDGTFGARVDYAAGAIPYSVVVGDFNGDGNLDLAVANDVAQTVSVFLGRGNGTFQTHLDYVGGSNPQSLAVGDFNNDGRLDLAVANYSFPNGRSTVSVLLQSPTLSLSKTNLSFGDQLIGTNSPSQIVTLTNTGYLTLQIAGITIIGTNATDFSQSHTCGSSLPAGASCNISVSFKPAALGGRTGVLTITDNATGSPQRVTLSGAGTVVKLVPSSLSFGNVALGSTSKKSVTLTNSGTSVLNIAAVAVAGMNAADYSQTNTCVGNVAAGASCVLTVTFKPSALGKLSAFLTVSDNGGGSPQTVPLAGTGTKPEFIYVTNINQITRYTVNSNTGSLITPSTIPGPNDPGGITADPSAKFLYASDFTGSAIDGFAVSATSGALTQISGSPYAVGTGNGAAGMATDSVGKFLFLAASTNKIFSFARNLSTGTLTAVAGSPFAAGTNPFHVIVHPSNKFLYASNYNDSMGGISAYSINSTTGALSPIAGSPFPTVAGFPGPQGLATDPSGKFLYVALLGTVNANHLIAAFTINSTTGALTAIQGSPFTTGNGPRIVAVHQSGRFLYTVNSHDNTVSAFTINSNTGVLTSVNGSPFAAGTFPFALAIDPAGLYLYTANQASNNVSGFSINSTSGALSRIAGSPFSGVTAPIDLTIVGIH